MELKMRNLSLWIKRSFSKNNSAFFCPTLFYSTLNKFSSHPWDYGIRTEMRILFSEKIFFGNTCSLISNVDISEINILAA